jgi:hypothetical protein
VTAIIRSVRQLYIYKICDVNQNHKMIAKDIATAVLARLTTGITAVSGYYN